MSESNNRNNNSTIDTTDTDVGHRRFQGNNRPVDYCVVCTIIIMTSLSDHFFATLHKSRYSDCEKCNGPEYSYERNGKRELYHSCKEYRFLMGNTTQNQN